MFWSCDLFICLYVRNQKYLHVQSNGSIYLQLLQRIKPLHFGMIRITIRIQDPDLEVSILTDCLVLIIFLLVLTHQLNTMGVIIITFRPLPPFIIIFNILPSLNITF